MAARRHAISASGSKLSQLWQLPLLLVSLGLFGYAAYVFIDPQPGLSVDDRIDIGRILLEQDRPEAAREQLNKVLLNEQMTIPQQGRVHLMLSESLEKEQKQKRLNIPANHQRIIEQVRLATGRGISMDGKLHRRLAESYEALGKLDDAIDHYRKAMALDADRSLPLQRKVIDLQLAADDRGGALLSLAAYLGEKKISDAERAWAIGEQAQIKIDQGQFAEARVMLDQAMKLELDPVAKGTLHYRLGYCAYKLGESDEAERLLRVARDELQIRHPLDADAAYLLGRIFQEKNDPQQANSFYQVVLGTHPDSRVAPLARLGRGICRVMLRQDDPALADFQLLVKEIASRPSRAKLKPEAADGLRVAAEALGNRENFAGALETLAYEQELAGTPTAGFFARLASVYERRAEQLEREMALAPQADRIRKDQLRRNSLLKAADSYVAYSRAQTLADDDSYGAALWKGVELYDRAGDTPAVISTLELFVAERPDDALAPEAVLRLGRAYQAAGMFDKAIAAYQRNQFRYPQSLAASKSAVPLAQAYVARGPESYGRAEAVLIGVVDNNPMITPDSQEFRLGLFELVQLYHRTARYEEAINRLQEFCERYPNDEKLTQLWFLMADSYRKSAAAIDPNAIAAKNATASATDAPPVDPVEAINARRQRLESSLSYYDRIIENWRGRTPVRDVDKLQLKLANFYRGDCLYDLGRYAEAVTAYDTAAFRYQDDPSALSAFVQIVNSYCALGKIDQAKAANERAKYLLRRIPPEAFKDGSFSMPKEYWEQWLKWTSEAGLW